MTNKYNIFLSYARADYTRKPPPPSARLLFEALERRGWSVFWDRKLKSGENIYQVIPERIKQSGCVVVAWSEQSIDSDRVLGEADKGRKLAKLLPVLLERVDPPMPFSAYHANDLTDWVGEDGHDQFALLVESISEKVGEPERPAAPVSERSGFFYPGVYVEGIPSDLRALEAASTSTAVFIGLTPRGDTAVPIFLTRG
jgi:hypothetical protein